MGRVTIALAIALAAPVAWSSDASCPVAMAAPVEAKLFPVLRALDRALRRNDIWDKGYEAAFARLMRGRGQAAGEARVALMDYYTGEAFGEELVCAVAKDGLTVLPTLERYEVCDIRPARSSWPRNHSLPLRQYAMKIIRESSWKESCTFE